MQAIALAIPVLSLDSLDPCLVCVVGRPLFVPVLQGTQNLYHTDFLGIRPIPTGHRPAAYAGRLILNNSSLDIV